MPIIPQKEREWEATMMKLYELSAHYQRVVEMMENGVEGLEDTLESIEESFEKKIENIIKLWRSKLAERDAIKAEIYRLQQRADKLDKDAEWLREYAEREMKNTNKTEVKSPLFSIKLGLTPPRVEVIDQDAIPRQFMRTQLKVEPDKVAIKEAISRGEAVPGVELKQDLKLKVR